MTDQGNPKPTQTDLYALRGQCRHMLVMSIKYRDRLKSMAKGFNVPQGLLVEVMMDQVDIQQITAAVLSRREARLAQRRPSKAALIKQIKRLGPSELIAFQALLAQKATDVEPECAVIAPDTQKPAKKGG